MKNFKCNFLVLALSGMIAADFTWARGGHGGSAGHRGHAVGGHKHIGSGHRHFHGGHRHFRGIHRHNRFNFGFNLGYYNPGYYGYWSYGYPPRYRAPIYNYPSYYPQTVIAPSAPIVYIQREEVRPARLEANYWYYCRNPEGYYPYVKKCPEGWLQVSPQPVE